jgi:uncharacterized protein (DUF608 family)/regulation of enolase protein 1 (concanavalin A-like superfamily)
MLKRNNLWMALFALVLGLALFTGINQLPVSVAAGAGAVDGTTGAPLGGIGAGAIKFCSSNGTFAYAERTPCAIDNFQSMANTQFQFYSNRAGNIQTSAKLAAVSSNGRYDDDAIYPIQTANFGVINDVAVSLTAFSPVNPVAVDQMCYPYAFFEIKVTNNLSSAVDAACAFQLGTSVTPSGVSGKGLATSGGVERAIYAKSNDAGAIISYGNDNGFFTSGQCNNSLSGATNRTVAKVTLSGNQTKYLKFVYAWYNGNDVNRYYYTNAYANAGSFADLGLANFDTLRDNAVNLVSRMRASNFPDWIKNHTLNSLCNLTNNSVYAKDGRYCHTEGEWNINGTMDQMWHGRQINTMLVPSIVWKELEFWARTQKTSPVGQIHHDFGTPMSALAAWDDAQHGDYRDIDKWVDLNCGFIVGVYEAFLATDDHSKLDYFWPYVKKAGQRVLDLVAANGDATYPYTFNGTENSYDAGGNPDPFNASMSAVAYKIMSNYAQLEGDTALKSTYDNAFNTVTNSFKNRYLTNNFPTGRICEAVMAGQWLAYYLKLGEFYPQSNIDYALGCLDSYYHPMTNGMGYNGGTYEEWAPYLISHYGGLLLQTGRLAEWRSMQYDYYERCYLDRNRVFNIPLDIPSKVGAPNYVSTTLSCYNQYISIPVLWRNYYTMVGYQRNKHTGELWLEPVIPTEMNHQMTDALYISPEGYGTVSCTESGTNYQNANLTIKSDNAIAVNGIYVKDKCGNNVTVTVGGVSQSISRIGTGYNKEIKVNWSGTVNSSGINIVVNGDPPPTTTPSPTPAPLNGFSQIEAENFSGMSGVQSEACSDTGGGQDVGFIENGDYTVYNNVDLGGGAAGFDVRFASNNSGGNIEVRLDDLNGTLVGTCAVTGTGGWQTWAGSSCSISGASGVHTLYLKFTGGTGYLFNLNWFKFTSSGATPTPTPSPTPSPTPTPTPTPNNSSAFSQIEAENFSSQSGIQTESCSEGGLNVGWIENGDYMVYNNLDFGTGATGFDARVASATGGGNIEVRLDSLTGTLVGTCVVAGTGGWQSWSTRSCGISGVSGVHNLYLKFTGGASYLFNVNWFKFTDSGATPTPTPSPTPSSTPTPLPAGSDDFNSGTLNSQWSWVREDNTHWSLTAAPGNMRITTQTGDIYQTYADAKNILLQNAGGDFTITTKVTFKPAQDYQQAGLIVYQDDNNYVKISRAYVLGNYFQFAKEVGGVFTDEVVADSIAGNTYYLKITKSGNNYTCFYSSDGTNFIQAGTTQSVSLGTIKIGLIACNSYPPDSELNADFDYFDKN